MDWSNSGHFIRHKWEIRDVLYPNKKLYDLLSYAPVSSYGHVGMVSSHTKAWTSGNKYFVHILLPFPDSNPSWMNQWNCGEWPKKLIYFMFNLHKSIGPGRDTDITPPGQNPPCSFLYTWTKSPLWILQLGHNPSRWILQLGHNPPAEFYN